MLEKPVTDYAHHGALTDPGPHGALFDDLPTDVAELSQIVQGLLIHDAFGRDLYGAVPAGFQAASRETLPIPSRIGAILAARDAPLSVARPPEQRSIGTCRDFALLLCAMLRQQGTPARVRCGFAKYFHPPSYEDHWVCEYWRRDRQAWTKVDPQLDAEHRAHLEIGFDTTDLPADQFLFAWQVWRMVQNEGADPALFGHGETTGAWFIQVNLARDLLSLHKREVSPWDRWREAPAAQRELNCEATLLCDRMAALAKSAQGLAPPGQGDVRLTAFLSLPPWQR